jgi:uncharacterized protein (UPF0210 family)
MKVRSITSFYDPREENSTEVLEKLRILSEKLNRKISADVMLVQSMRLATVPFPSFLPFNEQDRSIEQVIGMEENSRHMGWDYLSLGPALPTQAETYGLIPHLLAATRNTFLSAFISDAQFLYPAAARAAARVISQNAAIEKDGFANLRFAALANVGPHAPFLPAAYHKSGNPPAIAFAMECADVVVDAFQSAPNIDKARETLLEKLDKAAKEITKIFKELTTGKGIDLAGFDFSPAPYPVDGCSLGAGVEAVGIDHIGGNGSLAAVAIIANTLDQGTWKKAGFNGMMLPLLEDSRLSKRSIQEQLGLHDLLLYATLCGTGLDTIPLDGETTDEQLTSILMDVATLATRLGKPLTARLMPIPGKKAGDLTDFEFEYFSRARILSVSGQTLDPRRFGEDPIPLSPRRIIPG